MKTPRQCPSCGRGTVRLIALQEMKWEFEGRTLVIPVNFDVPMCDSCEEQWLDAERCAVLDKAIAAENKGARDA